MSIPENQIVGTVCRQTSVPTGESVEFRVEAVNGAGAVATESVMLNVDDRAPFVTFTKPVGVLPVNPWVGSVSGQIEIAGTIDGGLCGVEAFFIDGVQINVSQSGEFQRFLTFSEGQQAVAYEVLDAAGNRRSNNYAFRVDDTDPVVSIVNQVDEYTSDDSLELFIVANDTMSGINRSSLRINDVEYELARISQSQGEASVTVGLVEGRNEFEVVVEDVVGNLASTTVNIIRDTTAPILVVESPEENQALAAPAVV